MALSALSLSSFTDGLIVHRWAVSKPVSTSLSMSTLVGARAPTCPFVGLGALSAATRTRRIGVGEVHAFHWWQARTWCQADGRMLGTLSTFEQRGEPSNHPARRPLLMNALYSPPVLIWQKEAGRGAGTLRCVKEREVILQRSAWATGPWAAARARLARLQSGGPLRMRRCALGETGRDKSSPRRASMSWVMRMSMAMSMSVSVSMSMSMSMSM